MIFAQTLILLEIKGTSTCILYIVIYTTLHIFLQRGKSVDILLCLSEHLVTDERKVWVHLLYRLLILAFSAHLCHNDEIKLRFDSLEALHHLSIILIRSIYLMKRGKCSSCLGTVDRITTYLCILTI